MINKESILLGHIITEKATEASSHANQYTFKVAKDANRVSVKNSVESHFGVTVEKIQVLNTKPKFKTDRRRRGQVTRRGGFKKAIVRLKSGDSIDLA